MCLSPSDTVALTTPPSFDPCLCELAAALCAGTRACAFHPHTLADPDALASALVTRHVTVWMTTPARWLRLPDSARAALLRDRLRILALGGEGAAGPTRPAPVVSLSLSLSLTHSLTHATLHTHTHRFSLSL
jgi:non-ribosomal peptide synthetase component F